MTWFESLTGFRESSPANVRQNITVSGETLTSRANGKVMTYGQLETPSLAELRERVRSIQASGSLAVKEVIADVQALHTEPENAGSLFQVASQFNLLEMVDPDVTPEEGVGIYENDPTQGPACAIAAGAGTIYRNYFAPVNGKIGQSASNQIDCLADLGKTLGDQLWKMQNGCALASRRGLEIISGLRRTANEDEVDELRKLLRIGIQWNTQVTLNGCSHKVTQAYCSALPVAYSSTPADHWESFARLILEAAYEATMCTAILNSQGTRNKRVYLTLLGGGVFGNRLEWIIDALKRALHIYQNHSLEIAIVSHGRSKSEVRDLVEEFG